MVVDMVFLLEVVAGVFTNEDLPARFHDIWFTISDPSHP
jgi:hypothetical protein